MAYPFIWLAVIIIAVVAEGATAQLISIWAVIGGIGALIAGLAGADFFVQCFVFLLLTALALIVTRPFVKKVLNFKKTDTNADRYIGKSGIVVQEINALQAQGQVKALGNVWTARTEDDSVLPIGANVVIVAIEGVKLVVRPE